MLEGRKFIWAENHSYSFLLDYHHGGILHILNAKDSENNLLSSWRDDGSPAVGFMDFMLPNAELQATKLDQQLSDREGMLCAPYEYQIKRHDAGTDIALLSAQPLSPLVQGDKIRIEKTYSLSATGSDFTLDYKLTNLSSDAIKGFFGTLLDTGLLACGFSEKDILVDKKQLKFNFRDPLIFSEADEIQITDNVTQSRLQVKFFKKAAILVAPIFGASALAAPEALQGIRVFPFWKLELDRDAEFDTLFTVRISKR